MMNLLYIKACPRGAGISRTLMLADAFWDALHAHNSQVRVLTHDAMSMGLSAMDQSTLARREALIDAAAWDDPLFAPARAFVHADAVVIAAPYWDLLFPAALKVYIEHIFIRELTFRYRHDKPIGLCRAKRALFLTTAGSHMAPYDFGTEYLRATLAMLGIERFDSVAAEGLDMQDADAAALLQAAIGSAVRLAQSFT